MAVIQYWAATSVKSRFMLEYSFEDKTEGTEKFYLGRCTWDKHSLQDFLE